MIEEDAELGADAVEEAEIDTAIAEEDERARLAHRAGDGVTRRTSGGKRAVHVHRAIEDGSIAGVEPEAFRGGAAEVEAGRRRTLHRLTLGGLGGWILGGRQRRRGLHWDRPVGPRAHRRILNRRAIHSTVRGGVGVLHVVIVDAVAVVVAERPIGVLLWINTPGAGA